MARLESSGKMGYYPTPAKSLECFSTWFSYRGRNTWSDQLQLYHLLDPCAGNGHALKELAWRLNYRAKTYGIELDMERAIEAQKELDIATQGSLFDARVNPLGCMGLLYLNPPYDTDNGERLEMKFLKHAVKWLVEGGILMFLVPEHIFLEDKNREWIGQHFNNLSARRIHPEEFQRFKQVLVCGIKNDRRTETGILPAPPYDYMQAYEMHYTIPVTSGPKVFQGTATITDEDIIKHRQVACEVIARELGKLDIIDKRLSPILKPRKGHLVSQITGGTLDGVLPSRNEAEEPMLIVKGYSERSISVSVDEDKGIEITRDTYSTGIRVIKRNNDGGMYWYDVK